MNTMQKNACIFCSMSTGSLPVPIVAENNTAFVIKDIAPQAPIHYLIIPKKHIENVQALSTQELSIMADITALAQQLSRIDSAHQEFKLASNNGKGAGQHVMHLHIHFLAGY